MNYQNHFNFIHNNIENLSKEIINRRDLLLNYKDILIEFSKKHLSNVQEYKKICSKFPKISFDDDFSFILNYFKTLLENYVSIIESFHNNFIKIFETFQNFVTKQKNFFLNIKNEYNKDYNVYRNEFDNLKNIKSNYFNSCKKLEETLLNNKSKCNENNNNNENLKILYDNNFNIVSYTLKSELTYKNQIKNLNTSFNKYFYNIINIIENSKNLEKELIYFVKEKLKIYFMDYCSLLNNQQNLIDYGKEIINNLSTKNILKNLTKDFNDNLLKFSKPILFEPYEISFIKKIETNNQINVIKFFQKYFYNIAINYNDKFDKEKILFFNIIKKLFNNLEEVENKEIDIIYNLIKNNKIFRKNFLYFLNTQRNEGNFEFSEKLIKILGDIITIILNNNNNDNFEFCKFAILLSQTFYCKKFVNNIYSKIFIQEYIKNNIIFKDINFWISFLENNMKENLNKMNYNNNFNNDNNNNNNNLITSSDEKIEDNEFKNLLEICKYSEIIYIINNILNFNFDEILIKNFKEIINEKYKLNEEQNNEINDLIDNFYENEIYDKQINNQTKHQRLSFKSTNSTGQLIRNRLNTKYNFNNNEENIIHDVDEENDEIDFNVNK